MLYWFIIRVALKSLMANRLRSILAMLGIIIGVGAVISMLGIGRGAQKQIMDRVQAMGTNLIIVRPASTGSGGVMSGSSQNLKLEDAQAILEKVKDIKMISPVVQGTGQFKYLNKNSRTTFMGTATTYFPVRNFEIEKGRAFTDGEVEQAAHVAVLGSGVVEEIFGSDDPIDKVIRINSLNFTVIGVLKSKGDQGWFNPDNQAIIPFSTAMKKLLGIDYLREIDIQIEDGSDQMAIQTNVEELLRQRHRILQNMADDFQVRNMVEMVQAAQEMTKTFTILLGSVAAISLLVGGIGIMNIMLVTVTERTREIGIRKAIGAKDRDVLFQFLVESVIMSGLGGLIGLIIGVGSAMIIARFTRFTTVVEPSSVILAIVFSMGVGIFFGFYPAYRAAKLDPIDALQYE